MRRRKSERARATGQGWPVHAGNVLASADGAALSPVRQPIPDVVLTDEVLAIRSWNRSGPARVAVIERTDITGLWHRSGRGLPRWEIRRSNALLPTALYSEDEHITVIVRMLAEDLEQRTPFRVTRSDAARLGLTRLGSRPRVAWRSHVNRFDFVVAGALVGGSLLVTAVVELLKAAAR